MTMLKFLATVNVHGQQKKATSDKQHQHQHPSSQRRRCRQTKKVSACSDVFALLLSILLLIFLDFWSSEKRLTLRQLGQQYPQVLSFRTFKRRQVRGCLLRALKADRTWTWQTLLSSRESTWAVKLKVKRGGSWRSSKTSPFSESKARDSRMRKKAALSLFAWEERETKLAITCVFESAVESVFQVRQTQVLKNVGTDDHLMIVNLAGLLCRILQTLTNACALLFRITFSLSSSCHFHWNLSF